MSVTSMAQSHLKTLTATNPINRCPTIIVPAHELERFEHEYVFLFALARQLGKHFRIVKKELQDAGVEPVSNLRKIGATFYRRSGL